MHKLISEPFARQRHQYLHAKARTVYFVSPPKIFGGLAPIWVWRWKLHSPLSFGKRFMKIRSAVPENGCLIFMHYRCGRRKKQKKTDCTTYTHSRHLAARMRKLHYNTSTDNNGQLSWALANQFTEVFTVRQQTMLLISPKCKDLLCAHTNSYSEINVVREKTNYAKLIA